MYNTNKFHLGKLCKNGHEYKNTGKSLRYKSRKKECVECKKQQSLRHSAKQGRTSGSKSFPKTNSLEEAVLLRTNKKSSDECWEWQGQRRKPKGNAKSGYGRLEFKGKPYTAHKLVWELHNKTTVPNGYVVCHSCDNPCCVNPHHLFLGSNQDNMNDMKKKQRQVKGIKKYNSKLTPADIKYIRSLPLDTNWSEVARQLNVGNTTIQNVKNLKTWKHIK